MHETGCKPMATGPVLESVPPVNVWILSNADAGRSLSNDSLRELVRHAGHTVVGLISKGEEYARPPEHGVDLVVAAGGDGTVETAARLVAGTSIPLAILPLGTANNIATSLEIVADVPQLISSWHRARRVPFDLGRARAGSNEWLVVEGVGGGLIPAGIAAANRALESVDAHPAVEVNAAVGVFYQVLTKLKPVRMVVTIDDLSITEELLMLEVLNIRLVGPNLLLAPDASSSDGMFDVVLATPAHRSELLEYLARRMRVPPAAGHDTVPRLTLPRYRGRHVRIESHEEMHIDDERVDVTYAGGLDIEITPGAVTVLM